MTIAQLIRMAGWAATYALAVVLARQVLAPESGLALFWPAAGVAAMWLLADRSRLALARDAGLLFVVTVAALQLAGSSATGAIGLAVANTVQALAFRVGWRWLLAPAVDSLGAAAPRTAREVMLVAALALGAATAGSVPGVATAAFDGAAVGTGLWLGWVVRNGTGIAVLTLTVTGVVACSGQDGGLRRLGVGQRRAGLELVAAGAVSLLATVLVFADPAHRPVAFAVLLPAVWFGLRFSPGAAAAHGLVQGALAVSLSVAGLGPFGRTQALSERALTVQAFVFLAVLLACLLAVATSERQGLLTQAELSARRAKGVAQESRRRAALLEAITAGIHEGLLVVARDGSVVVSNPAAQKILRGRLPVRIDLGSPSAIDAVSGLDGKQISAQERPSARALAGEAVSPVDVAVLDPATQAVRLVSVSASPVDPSDDMADRLAVMVLRDVTDERAAVEELHAFAGVVAHDLKNPVAAVMSWSEILDDELDELDTDASGARTTLLRIYATAERVQRLIDDLLAYAQAGSGDLHRSVVPLLPLCQEALDQAPPGDLARSTVDLVCDPELVVEIDVVLVRQALSNLFANAMKYSTGHAVVRMEAHADGERVRIVLEDEGIGIPVEDQSRVFDGFFRSSRTAATFPGTGLGLAICARAVRRHGGDITASDAASGTGTRIELSLPRGYGRSTPTSPQTEDL